MRERKVDELSNEMPKELGVASAIRVFPPKAIQVVNHVEEFFRIFALPLAHLCPYKSGKKLSILILPLIYITNSLINKRNYSNFGTCANDDLRLSCQEFLRR